MSTLIDFAEFCFLGRAFCITCYVFVKDDETWKPIVQNSFLIFLINVTSTFLFLIFFCIVMFHTIFETTNSSDFAFDIGVIIGLAICCHVQTIFYYNRKIVRNYLEQFFKYCVESGSFF